MSETERTRLHELVDALPESKVETANKYLERLLSDESNAFLQALLDAPEDDEPLTEGELKAIEEGRKAISEGRVKSWEQVKRDLGL